MNSTTKPKSIRLRVEDYGAGDGADCVIKTLSSATKNPTNWRSLKKYIESTSSENKVHVKNSNGCFHLNTVASILADSPYCTKDIHTIELSGGHIRGHLHKCKLLSTYVNRPQVTALLLDAQLNSNTCGHAMKVIGGEVV